MMACVSSRQFATFGECIPAGRASHVITIRLTEFAEFSELAFIPFGELQLTYWRIGAPVDGTFSIRVTCAMSRALEGAQRISRSSE